MQQRRTKIEQRQLHAISVLYSKCVSCRYADYDAAASAPARSVFMPAAAARPNQRRPTICAWPGLASPPGTLLRWLNRWPTLERCRLRCSRFMRRRRRVVGGTKGRRRRRRPVGCLLGADRRVVRDRSCAHAKWCRYCRSRHASVDIFCWQTAPPPIALCGCSAVAAASCAQSLRFPSVATYNRGLLFVVTSLFDRNRRVETSQTKLSHTRGGIIIRAAMKYIPDVWCVSTGMTEWRRSICGWCNRHLVGQVCFSSCYVVNLLTCACQLFIICGISPVEIYRLQITLV